MCGARGPSWAGLCLHLRWQLQGQQHRRRHHQGNYVQCRRCLTPSVALNLADLLAEPQLRLQASPSSCWDRRQRWPASSESLHVLRGKRKARADGRWPPTATGGPRRGRRGRQRPASWLGRIGLEVLGSLLDKTGLQVPAVDWPSITQPRPGSGCRRTCARRQLPRSCWGKVAPSSPYFPIDQLTCCRRLCRRVMSCPSPGRCSNLSQRDGRRRGRRDRFSAPRPHRPA
mmetsp:Transcript_78081/g.208760  ORF Transcript_78081/g.208760 Transcript_78081/m.208760 type:complete len:229 (-) Transcript_78081:333-1019(-)